MNHHEWDNHRCRIDRVLTRGWGRAFRIRTCNSGHTMVAATVRVEMRSLRLRVINWDKVRAWLEAEGGSGEERREYHLVGETYSRANREFAEGGEPNGEKQKVESGRHLGRRRGKTRRRGKSFTG